MSLLAYQVSAIAQCAACIYLIVCGRRAGLLRSYPFFYAYISFSALGLLAMVFVLHPRQSEWPVFYGHAYFLRGILAMSLAVVVTWQLYRLPKRLERDGSRRMVGPWAALAAGVVLFWAFGEGGNTHVYYRLTAALYGVVYVLGGTTIARLYSSNGLRAGDNVMAIVGGLAFYHGVGVADHLLVMARDWWDLSSFHLALEPLAYLRWAFFVWGLRTADPPRALEPVDQKAVRAAIRARLKEAAKGLKS